MPPDSGRPRDQASWPGIQQGRHRSLVYSDGPRRGRVDAWQNALPPSVRLGEVVDPAPAEPAVKCLAPANDAKLIQEQTRQARTVIYGFDWHEDTVSPPTDRTASLVRRRSESQPGRGAPEVGPA